MRNDTEASGALPQAGLPARAAIAAPMEALLEAAPDGAGSERLDLSSRNLTDLSALAGLTGLRELDLRDNAIADLSPAGGTDRTAAAVPVRQPDRGPLAAGGPDSAAATEPV